jgi:hypothetical protein
MTQDELLNRLHRIYASVKVTAEFNMTKLPSKIICSREVVGIYQNFTGELSDSDIANAAQSVIHNIASLQDHLKKWAADNGKHKTKVDDTFAQSLDLQIIKDLWVNDKHGYHPRKEDGWSHKLPKLQNIHRQMRLTTQNKAGSFVTMVIGSGGVPNIVGDGSACAVITGDVVDKDGKPLGDLFDIEQRAVEVWESLLQDYGVLPTTANGT